MGRKPLENIDDVLRLIDIELDKKGWRRSDLVKKLGRTDAWLSKIMKKERGLSVQALLEISRALDINPASLLPERTESEPKISFEEYIRHIIRDELEKLKKK